MPETREFRFPSARPGYSLYAREWLPQGPPRAAVQIVHGLTDHIGRYQALAQFLTSRGFLVCGEDHLGHGRTVEDGRYGCFAPEGGWDYALRDVHRLRELEEERHPGLPYVLLGHSLGSFLVRGYLEAWPGTLSGALLAGTGQAPAPLLALGRALVGLECRRLGPQGVSPLTDLLMGWMYNRPFRPVRTGADWLSRDEAEVDAYLADPLCRPRPSAALLRDTLEGLQAIVRRDNLKTMDPDTPLLLLSGDRDPVGGMGREVRKVERLLREAGCRDVTCKLYPGARHELFHEANRAEVFQDILVWLEDKLPPAP